MKEDVSSDSVDVLDLRGVKCPTTFAYTKIRLEEMEKNRLLDVIVYRKNTAESIAKTAEKDGHEIVFIKKGKHANDNVWIVRIRKAN